MVMSADPKINFLGMENVCMIFIVSTLPLHSDRLDVPHDLLQHCFIFHGNVCGHQDQLLGIRELFNVILCIYFASSCWSFWCATWPTSTPLHTSWPCPWPPRSTSWGWRTSKCCTLHPLHLFMLIASNVVHWIYLASSCWSFWCTAWHTSTLQWTSRPWPSRSTSGARTAQTISLSAYLLPLKD